MYYKTVQKLMDDMSGQKIPEPDTGSFNVFFSPEKGYYPMPTEVPVSREIDRGSREVSVLWIGYGMFDDSDNYDEPTVAAIKRLEAAISQANEAGILPAETLSGIKLNTKGRKY